jgi:hypothetical protein
MRTTILGCLLLLGCPTTSPVDDEDSEDPTPPPTDDDDVETWLYTGTVYGTDEVLDVFVGEDSTTTRPDSTWSLRSSAGPAERVDVLDGAGYMRSYADCGREHSVYAYTFAESDEVPLADLQLTLHGASADADVTGTFISVDATNTFRTTLRSDEFVVDGDTLTLEREIEVGSLWKLHLWATEDGRLVSDVSIDGDSIEEGEQLVQELTLGPRIYQQVTLMGDLPEDLETLSLSEYLRFGDVGYSAVVYSGPGVVDEPLSRIDASANLTARFQLTPTDACSLRQVSVSLNPIAGDVVLEELIELPTLAPEGGVWSARPSLELGIPEGAERVNFSVGSGDLDDSVRWWLQANPGCTESTVAWPEPLGDLALDESLSAYAFTSNEVSTAFCVTPVVLPED